MKFEEVYNALLKKINEIDSFELNPHNLITLLKI